MKVRSLPELKTLRKALAEQAARLAAERAAAEAARREAEERAHKDRLLFERTVGAVQRLPHHGRHLLRPQPPLPRPQQRELDEQAVMREALSDEFDVETLLHIDEHLSFRRTGVGPEVARKLRQGDWSIQAQIDLHGLRTDEARETLASFIREAHKRGLRCVRVVHGKGTGALRRSVEALLGRHPLVASFRPAGEDAGGWGATLVALRD